MGKPWATGREEIPVAGSQPFLGSQQRFLVAPLENFRIAQKKILAGAKIPLDYRGQAVIFWPR